MSSLPDRDPRSTSARPIPDRIAPPPHDPEAEASVLGCMLLHRDAIDEVRTIVAAEDFYSGAHRTIFEAIAALHDRGGAVDTIILVDELARRGHLEAVGGHLALADLLAGVATPTHAPAHARVVADKARRRRASEAAERARDLALAGNFDAAAVAAQSAAQAHADDVVTMADINPSRVRFFWPGRIAFGKVANLQGDSDLGKTTIALDLAARATTRSPMPVDGHRLDRARGAVILTAEDALDDTIVPRLLSHGADLSRVVTLSRRRDVQGNVLPHTIPDDLPRLARAVAKVDAAIVVVDPISAMLPETVQSHNDSSVRRALTPLVEFAERTGVAVVCVRHLNKSREQSAKHRGGGSVAFDAAARTVLVVEEHPDDNGVNVLAQPTHNLSGDVPSLGYRIAPDDRHGCGHIQWQGTVDVGAEDLLNHDARADAPDRDEAEKYLVALLAEGPRPSTQVLKKAREDLGVSEKTLRRAAKRVGIASSSRRDTVTGRHAEWVWELPK